MKFLSELLFKHSVSGDETEIAHFIFDYVRKQSSIWKVPPEIYFGEEYHDCLMLKFGVPRTAVFAHLDTIGFMTRYENQLVAVGGPEVIEGTRLVGRDSKGDILCRIIGDEQACFHDLPRGIDRGTRLSFEQNIRVDEEYIQAAYLDNRLGIYNALKLCETLENGWVVFSTYEEHGGGSMPALLNFIQTNSPIRQALISDITWITEGVEHHKGVVISIRDKYIPRKKFINKLVSFAEKSGVPFQLEVEAYGGSDGREVQFSSHFIDWCFVGAAEDQVHTPDEKVSLFDLDCMLRMYSFLMEKL
ncbi:hypothetical protein GCM10009119_14380 [Algoriphagus jejuensis]|uniref:Aminopeptidase FrvX n=1 Tax=Algoriphagus jejuensis TaxID=419934 RepID=A0ABP3YAI4_9BACT